MVKKATRRNSLITAVDLENKTDNKKNKLQLQKEVISKIPKREIANAVDTPKIMEENILLDENLKKILYDSNFEHLGIDLVQALGLNKKKMVEEEAIVDPESLLRAASNLRTPIIDERTAEHVENYADVKSETKNIPPFSTLGMNTTSPTLHTNFPEFAEENLKGMVLKKRIRTGPGYLNDNLNVYSACYFIDRLAASLKAPRRIEMVAFELLHILCTTKEISFRDIPAVATACFFLSNKICVDDCMTLRFRHVLKGAQKVIENVPLFKAAVMDRNSASSLLTHDDDILMTTTDINEEKKEKKNDKNTDDSKIKNNMKDNTHINKNVNNDTKVDNKINVIGKLSGSNQEIESNSKNINSRDSSNIAPTSATTSASPSNVASVSQKDVLSLERIILIAINFNLSFEPPNTEGGALESILTHITVPRSVSQEAYFILSQDVYRFSTIVLQDHKETGARNNVERRVKWLRTVSYAALLLAVDHHNSKCLKNGEKGVVHTGGRKKEDARRDATNNSNNNNNNINSTNILGILLINSDRNSNSKNINLNIDINTNNDIQQPLPTGGVNPYILIITIIIIIIIIGTCCSMLNIIICIDINIKINILTITVPVTTNQRVS